MGSEMCIRDSRGLVPAPEARRRRVEARGVKDAGENIEVEARVKKPGSQGAP